MFLIIFLLQIKLKDRGKLLSPFNKENNKLQDLVTKLKRK